MFRLCEEVAEKNTLFYANVEVWVVFSFCPSNNKDGGLNCCIFYRPRGFISQLW